MSLNLAASYLLTSGWYCLASFRYWLRIYSGFALGLTPNIVQQLGGLAAEKKRTDLKLTRNSFESLGQLDIIIIIMISKSNREIRVEGLGRLSLKYIENFFKKAGSISKITVHKHYVVIRYSSEQEARNALAFNGKILEEEQLRIKINRDASTSNHSRRLDYLRLKTKHYKLSEEDAKLEFKAPPYKIPLSVYNFEELEIQKHFFEAKSLILGLTTSEFKKALLYVVFEEKKKEVQFFAKNKESTAHNQSIGYLESIFNEDLAMAPKNVNNQEFYLLKLKDRQTSTSEVKRISDWADAHQKFVQNLTKASERLGKLYFMFNRQSLINTSEYIVSEENSTETMEVFTGCAAGSFCNVIFNQFKKFFTENILIHRELEKFSLIARLPKLKYLQQNSFSNLYKVNEESHSRQKLIQLPDNIFVMEMDSLCFRNPQSLTFLHQKYRLFTQLYEKTGTSSLFVTFYSDNESQQKATLDCLSSSLRDKQPHQVYAISVTSIALFQAFLHEQFITNYVDSYKGDITQQTAIFLAKSLVKDRPDQLFGTYNINTIASEIMKKNAEKGRRRTQSLIDKYSLSTL